jgi:phosphoserine/homoserine phosphotransferase
MDGAREFLDELRSMTQVVILSDTFEQFGAPLMRQLGMPTLLCHRLQVEDDHIRGYTLRMQDQKRHAVEAFRRLNFHVVSAGDSYNDAAMLAAADAGFWFRAPSRIRDEFPQFPSTDSYDELLALVTGALT